MADTAVPVLDDDYDFSAFLPSPVAAVLLDDDDDADGALCVPTSGALPVAVPPSPPSFSLDLPPMSAFDAIAPVQTAQDELVEQLRMDNSSKDGQIELLQARIVTLEAAQRAAEEAHARTFETAVAKDTAQVATIYALQQDILELGSNKDRQIEQLEAALRAAETVVAAAQVNQRTVLELESQLELQAAARLADEQRYELLVADFGLFKMAQEVEVLELQSRLAAPSQVEASPLFQSDAVHVGVPALLVDSDVLAPPTASPCPKASPVLSAKQYAVREFAALTATERKKLSVAATKDFAERLGVAYKGTKTAMLDVLQDVVSEHAGLV